MYSRQREACFSSGRHATNLAETTDGVGWLEYLLCRLGVAIGMQQTAPHAHQDCSRKRCGMCKSAAAKLSLFMAGEGSLQIKTEIHEQRNKP